MKRRRTRRPTPGASGRRLRMQQCESRRLLSADGILGGAIAPAGVDLPVEAAPLAASSAPRLLRPIALSGWTAIDPETDLSTVPGSPDDGFTDSSGRRVVIVSGLPTSNLVAPTLRYSATFGGSTDLSLSFGSSVLGSGSVLGRHSLFGDHDAALDILSNALLARESSGPITAADWASGRSDVLVVPTDSVAVRPSADTESRDLAGLPPSSEVDAAPAAPEASPTTEPTPALTPPTGVAALARTISLPRPEQPLSPGDDVEQFVAPLGPSVADTAPGSGSVAIDPSSTPDRAAGQADQGFNALGRDAWADDSEASPKAPNESVAESDGHPVQRDSDRDAPVETTKDLSRGSSDSEKLADQPGQLPNEGAPLTATENAVGDGAVDLAALLTPARQPFTRYEVASIDVIPEPSINGEMVAARDAALALEAWTRPVGVGAPAGVLTPVATADSVAGAWSTEPQRELRIAPSRPATSTPAIRDEAQPTRADAPNAEASAGVPIDGQRQSIWAYAVSTLLGGAVVWGLRQGESRQAPCLERPVRPGAGRKIG